MTDKTNGEKKGFSIGDSLAKIKKDRVGFMKMARAKNRELNREARELGYPRGIKQMKEEGVL